MFFLMIVLWTGGLIYGAYQYGAHILGKNLFSSGKSSYLIVLFVLWGIGIFLLRFLFKKNRSKKIVQQAVADHPFVPVKGFVPHAMPSQGKSMTLTPQITNSAVQNSPVSSGTPMTQTTPPESKTHSLESEAVQEITKIAEEKGLTAFPHVLLQNIMLPLTVSSDIKALLFKFLSIPGSWHVDEAEELSKSLWTNQGKSFLVTKEILQAKETLMQMEPAAEVIPVIVLLDGHLENEEETQSYLKQFKAEVVYLNHKENSNLISVSELFDEMFKEPIPPMPTLKEDENDENNIA